LDEKEGLELLLVIDNGCADKICSMISCNYDVLKPEEATKKLGNADAVIIPDGSAENRIKKIAESLSSPCLAIGTSAEILAETFGAKIGKNKKKDNRGVKIKLHSPLTLGIKKRFVVHGKTNVIEELPDDFETICSGNGPEIYQHINFPIFGVLFELEGEEGKKIINNFLKFAETWAKYH